MIELILVSSDLEDEKRILESDVVDKFYFHFVDSGSALQKKESYTLKTEWGARKEPFAIVQTKDKVLRCFYSEKNNKVIDDALEFIKGLKETYG